MTAPDLDPKLTLPKTPELGAWALEVAQRRQTDFCNALDPGIAEIMGDLSCAPQDVYAAIMLATITELRDLRRPESCAFAMQKLGEMLCGPHAPHEQGGWQVRRRSHSGPWTLRGTHCGASLNMVPHGITDPREALCIALSSQLEARRA